MTQCKRVRLTGTIRVPLPPKDAFAPFTVTCEPWEDQTTIATIRYDLTALAPEANAELDRFAARYPSFLDQWQRAVAEAITAPGNPT